VWWWCGGNETELFVLKNLKSQIATSKDENSLRCQIGTSNQQGGRRFSMDLVTEHWKSQIVMSIEDKNGSWRGKGIWENYDRK